MYGPRNPHEPLSEPQTTVSLLTGEEVSITEYEDGKSIQVAVLRGSRALNALLGTFRRDLPLIDVHSPEDLDDPFLYLNFWHAGP